MKKELLKIAERVARKTAVIGAGAPTSWGFYEDEVPQQLLNQTKKHVNKEDEKCAE